MHLKLIIPALFLALGGCAAQGPVFSWYHPEGGEYLFAFDAEQCEDDVTAGGASMDADTQGPFFACMHQRGYYLVDASGIVQAPPATDLLPEQQAASAR